MQYLQITEEKNVVEPTADKAQRETLSALVHSTVNGRNWVIERKVNCIQCNFKDLLILQ